MSSEVLYQRRGPIAWITLNRPQKLNALNEAVVNGVGECVAQAAADDDAHVVVFAGAGRAFSAGFDIAEEIEKRVDTVLEWHQVLSSDVAMTMAVWSLSKPTIAAVRGWCLAGACELAMACDMVVAA